uniref:transmembrane protein 150A-like isoform X5 n=1 Tax=Myxine glutinosa TaxID=7769 RepID=UPI00358DF7E5
MTGLASWFLEDLGQKTFSGPPHEGESEIQMLSWVLLPICFPVFAIIGIWIAYGMAVYYQHVCPLNNWSYNISCPAVEPDARFGPKSCCTIQDIPLVSKCGAYPPESCLFSLVGNLGSFMVLWICSLRYCQLVEQQQQSWLNRLALGAGSVSAVGLIAVSNFQVDSVKVLHYVGASVAFLAVTFYLCLQTVLTYRTAGLLGYNWLGHARSFFTLMATVTLILSGAFFGEDDSRLQHASAICEWAFTLVVLSFFGMFSFDFRVVSRSTLLMLVSPVARIPPDASLTDSESASANATWKPLVSPSAMHGRILPESRIILPATTAV